jgi:integrase
MSACLQDEESEGATRPTSAPLHPRQFCLPKGADIVQVRRRMAAVAGSTLAESSKVSIARAVAVLRSFNELHFPEHPDVLKGTVRFFAGIASDGVECSVEEHVRLFFASLAGRAQATVCSYKWALGKYYQQQGFGPAPWVTQSARAHPEAAATAQFVRSVVRLGDTPQAPEAMTSELFHDLVAFFRHNAGKKTLDVSSFMMAAALALLMGGMCRFQDVRRARFEYVKDYADPLVRESQGGVASGIDVCFPPFVRHEQLGVVRGRRKHNTQDLVVRVPEVFACGMSPAAVLREFLVFAPKTGHLFRPSLRFARDQWVPDKERGCLTNGFFNKRLQLAIRKVRPAWDALYVKRFSSHSFRGGATNSMSVAGVPISVVTQSLGHTSEKAVRLYLHLSGEVRRNALQYAL